MRPNLLVDSRDIRFILFEMFDVQSLSQYEPYKEFDRDTYEAVLDLAEQIAMEEVYPANTVGDKEGVQFNPEKHTVTVPQSYKKAMQAFRDAGFTGLVQPADCGGMGMPDDVSLYAGVFPCCKRSIYYLYYAIKRCHQPCAHLWQ